MTWKQVDEMPATVNAGAWKTKYPYDDWTAALAECELIEVDLEALGSPPATKVANAIRNRRERNGFVGLPIIRDGRLFLIPLDPDPAL